MSPCIMAASSLMQHQLAGVAAWAIYLFFEQSLGNLGQRRQRSIIVGVSVTMTDRQQRGTSTGLGVNVI
jgi:hypothetical protein